VGNDPTNILNRASSALKLTRSGSTLSVASWFTPFNYQYLNTYDIDYGSMGSLLIPSSNYWVTGGKDGKLYLLNKDNLGGYNASSNQIQQEIFLNGNANMHCQAAYYKGSAKEWFYVWSENDPLRAFPFDRTSSLLESNNQTVFSQGGPTGQSGAVLSV